MGPWCNGYRCGMRIPQAELISKRVPNITWYWLWASQLYLVSVCFLSFNAPIRLSASSSGVFQVKSEPDFRGIKYSWALVDGRGSWSQRARRTPTRPPRDSGLVKEANQKLSIINIKTYNWTIITSFDHRICYSLCKCHFRCLSNELIINIFMYKCTRASRADLTVINKKSLMGHVDSQFHCSK